MFEMSLPMMAVALVFWHTVADYPLQGDFLASGKNRNTQLGKLFWPHCLSAHAIIHGGGVALITGLWWLGIAEAIIHAVTDWMKCENKIGMRADQSIHYGCKALWLLVAYLFA